ncbi:GNAT family N-acetyltransferase [Roseibium sp.]|uniref:GNAT family N-acetyltransferase n=1 Tax=Roseibium sp. TaxID=1936156 RepID=UPI003A985D74
MKLRTAATKDLPALLQIHNHAVRNLTAAWTEQEETVEERAIWLEGRGRDGFPVIVAVDDEDDVLGFGSFGPFRARPGYRKTVEHSIYVRSGAQGVGTGAALMQKLIELARADGYHVMVGAVDAENETSLKFHRKLGFDVSCKLPQVGTKFGRWLDLYMVTLVLNDDPAPPSMLPSP